MSTELTKAEILIWYHTSRLPSPGTEELNKFMKDVAITYGLFAVLADGSQAGIRYINLSAALKAFVRYKFSEGDIKKMYADHDLYVENSKKWKIHQKALEEALKS